MEKVEVHMKELFEKSEKNEKGLADSLDTLERKVPPVVRYSCIQRLFVFCGLYGNSASGTIFRSAGPPLGGFWCVFFCENGVF